MNINFEARLTAELPIQPSNNRRRIAIEAIVAGFSTLYDQEKELKLYIPRGKSVYTGKEIGYRATMGSLDELYEAGFITLEIIDRPPETENDDPCSCAIATDLLVQWLERRRQFKAFTVTDCYTTGELELAVDTITINPTREMRDKYKNMKRSLPKYDPEKWITDYNKIRMDLKKYNNLIKRFKWTFRSPIAMNEALFKPLNEGEYRIKPHALVYRRGYNWHEESDSESVIWSGRYFNSSISELHGAYKMRSTIKINGHDTIEADFKSMHISMLYNNAGLDAPENCYTLFENQSEQMRNIIKKIALVCVNSSSPRGCIWTVEQSIINAKEGDWLYGAEQTLQQYDTDVKSLYEMFCRQHKPISGCFCKKQWGMLQTIETKITSSVLQSLTDAKIPAYIAHDSFIVRDSDKEFLLQAMRSSYEAVMSFQPIIECK